MSMSRSRGVAAACLTVGLILAVGTPVVVGLASPSLAGYVLHPPLLVFQATPWLLCAGLWLPRGDPTSGRIALVLSSVMLVAALVLHVPVLWSLETVGGDMSGIYFAGAAFGTTAFVVLGSLIGWMLRWIRRPPNYLA
jgi:hypothetical protein